MMNKKNEVKKQLEMINVRLDVLINKWNRQYDQNIQELLQLSTLLQNLETGSLETNKTLLK
jgi:hypothetical protein